MSSGFIKAKLLSGSALASSKQSWGDTLTCREIAFSWVQRKAERKQEVTGNMSSAWKGFFTFNAEIWEWYQSSHLTLCKTANKHITQDVVLFLLHLPAHGCCNDSFYPDVSFITYPTRHIWRPDVHNFQHQIWYYEEEVKGCPKRIKARDPRFGQKVLGLYLPQWHP